MKAGGKTAAPSKRNVEASGTVEVGNEELFHFTDWCYDVPKWFSSIDQTRILTLPDSSGMGKITHYHGRMMGREMEWEGESAEWVKNEVWMMKAISGAPAKMGMELRLRFEAAGPGETKVTCAIGYRMPYSILGSLLDRLYIRRELRRLVNDAIGGMKLVASQHKVPPLELQFEKRKLDHPGYEGSSTD